MDEREAIRIIGSTPTRSVGEGGSDFIERFKLAVEWADRANWNAALIYTSNNALDPWLLAQILIQMTTNLRPLVAVQPIYEHPFTVANQASTLTALYDRGVDFNFVAGDHPRDRESLNDTVEHDERYVRLSEYAQIVKQLFSFPRPVSFYGRYYTVSHLHLGQRPTSSIFPSFFMSGSSAAAREIASQIGACAIEYPEEPGKAPQLPSSLSFSRGVRIGVIARSSNGEAWDAAHRRFPPDIEGEAIRKFAATASDSEWVKTLLHASAQEQAGAYWLSPFRRFQRACPYLVGSHEEVGAILKYYVSEGYRTFLIDAVESAEEACCITELIRTAAA